MTNLEIMRAKHATELAKTLNRSAVNKLPALILTNGLLATAAFCQSESSGEGRDHMKRAMDATAKYLEARGLLARGATTTKDLINHLRDSDSHHLQLATAEALAFLAYLKRFAPQGD